MTDNFKDLMCHAGLTSCWDKMDEDSQAAIEKFAELIVRECTSLIDNMRYDPPGFVMSPSAHTQIFNINKHFGVE